MQVKKKPKKTAKAVPEKSRKKKQPGEGQIKKQPFLKRMLFGEEKPDLSELEAGSTTILDILSPTTVDTKSRDYIIVDDVYHAYLYITGYGYTTTVGTCWLAPLVEAGEGINLSFLVKRQPKEKILSKIAQTTMVNRSRMRDVGDTRQDYEELDSAISSGLYLKDVMNRQGENFYYMHTLIEVTAPDPETLEQRVTEVEKLCVSVDMIARRCDYKNEQAFLSALPILALDPDIERKARRNALTSGVAAAFPFVSYELSDHDGIFLGLNLYNRSPVFLNPYDDYKYTSGNWWIGGSTGAGKTVTLQCLGGRLREQGKRVIIIVPKKGHEFRPLCERLGGLYLRMSPSSKDCPNLMAIRRKSLDSYAKLKNIAARDDSVLADKIAQLIIWFSLKKKDLREEDKSRLDSSLVEVYKRYGITFDNSTIVDENGNFRTMPILSDWYEILYQEQDTRHLAVVLSRYVTGSAAAMAGRNDIELNNKYIVLDLSGMPDDMIADGTFWATSIAYDLIMNCEDELSALLADELWSLVGATANPQAAGFVLEMVKTIRGLGGIAVTSTQGMQDLFSLEGGSYGKGILDSSRIKLVMQMEEQEARLIQDKLNLSEDEVRQITRFRRGEGLLCIGYNHVPIAFHTTPKEYEAISGDFPAELPEGDLPAEETAEQSETLPAMEAAEAKPLGLSTEEKTTSQDESDTAEERAEEAELHEEMSEFPDSEENLISDLPTSVPQVSEADEADWGFEEPVTEEAAAEPAEDEYLAADNAETLDASDEKSERTLFYELDFNELDRGLSEEERKEWNSIYASFRGRSAITGTIIGVDLYARYLPRSEARMLENKRELCAVVVPYRIPILIRESEMWELGEERPDFVLRNMVGASIDVIVTKVERTANRAQASRRQASRSQRRFFAAREDLHAVGSRITCRMLAVGPRRCLVDCYGYDLDMTQREIRYAAIPDLRTEFHPGSEIDCIVKEYHPRTGELIVSAKETEVNPFFGAEERHPVGSRRFAMISGKYGGGVFCNLPDGVTCMCNYSYQHEDADFMVGEHVMLMVQRYDQEKLQMYGKIMSKW